MPVLYTERLTPPVWVWVLGLCFGVSVGFTFWVPFGMTFGIVSGIIVTALVLWWLWTTSPRITVTNQELQVGRAHIELYYVGLIARLDADSTARARGAEADPRAFAVMRPLSAKESITIEVCDDEDPHPYWLISSRDPQAFGNALVQAQQAA